MQGLLAGFGFFCSALLLRRLLCRQHFHYESGVGGFLLFDPLSARLCLSQFLRFLELLRQQVCLRFAGFFGGVPPCGFALRFRPLTGFFFFPLAALFKSIGCRRTNSGCRRCTS
ncbi:MAG: hypothetical protein ACOYYI_06555 [Chloroflexota bacterium]